MTQTFISRSRAEELSTPGHPGLPGLHVAVSYAAMFFYVNLCEEKQHESGVGSRWLLPGTHVILGLMYTMKKKEEKEVKQKDRMEMEK